MAKKKPIPSKKRLKRPHVEEVYPSSSNIATIGSTELWGLKKIQLIAIVIGLSLLAFLPVFTSDFIIWDDPEYTYENPLIKDFSYAKVFDMSTFHLGNYHPLTITWYYWESKLFGFNATAFHVNNLFLHLVNVLLVFLIVIRLSPKGNLFIPALTAGLFGVHPMHVESVAWISELKDVLYALFFLLAIWRYLVYIDKRNWHDLVIVLVCFVLSILSKGQAVVLPVVLVLIDLFKRRKTNLRSLAEKIPFFALSIYFGLLAIDAQVSESAINKDYQGLDAFFYGSYGLIFYLQKLFLPISLSGAHPYPFNPVFEDMPSYFKIMPLLVLLVIGVVLWFSKKRSYLWMGFGFFLITVSIVLKLIPVGDTIVAERYTYIPYIGLFFLLAHLINDLMKNQSLKEGLKIGSIAVLALFTLMSYGRTQVWKNNQSFWTDVSDKYPNYWRSYNNMGEEYERKEDYKNALVQYQLAGQKDKYAPPVPFLKQGLILLNRMKDVDGAINAFKRATEFPNKSDDSHLNARISLSQALVMANRHSESIKNLEGLENNYPNEPEIYYRRAIAYSYAKSFDAALANFEKCISMRPNHATYYLRRGVMFTDVMGRYEEGIRDFRKVLELKPNHMDAGINTGVALYKSGRNQEAIKQYNNMLEAFPDQGRVYFLRALAYAASNQFKLAYQDSQVAMSQGINMDQTLVQGWKQSAGL